MKLVATLTLFLASWFSVCAQHQVNQLLFDHAQSTPEEISEDFEELVEYLIKPTTSELEIATVLAYWVMINIEYDVEAFANNTHGNETWTTVFFDKKAVCSGYSTLYAEFCRYVGIPNFEVRGFAKGFKKTDKNPFTATNHGWNVILIDNKYHLLDLTWASGYLKKTGDQLSFVKKIRFSEVFADPKEFVEKHLPGQPRWQLLEHPISMRSYYANEQYEEMLDPSAPYYNYDDSIQAYSQLSIYDRMIKDANDAYNLHPIPDELAIWYDIAAHGFSTSPFDEKQLKKGKKYYRLAKDIYLSLAPEYGSAADNCEKGIKYIDYRLSSGR